MVKVKGSVLLFPSAMAALLSPQSSKRPAKWVYNPSYSGVASARLSAPRSRNGLNVVTASTSLWHALDVDRFSRKPRCFSLVNNHRDEVIITERNQLFNMHAPANANAAAALPLYRPMGSVQPPYHQAGRNRYFVSDVRHKML